MRLVHPFPSILNGAVVLAIGLIAGGDPGVALRLAAAMTLLQMAIGTFNDLADAPRDGGRIPPKPIPIGAISARHARAVGVGSALGGLLLVLPSGPATLAVALLGLGCGLVYDLWLSRSVISWVPLSIALPLVPVFAWIGTTGGLPRALVTLLPIAVLAGGGLAVGNALVDTEPDDRAGRRTIAVAIGRAGAWRVQSTVLLLAVGLAARFLPAGGGALSIVCVAVGLGAVALGIVLALAEGRARRRLAWQIEAAGVAAVAVGWVLAAARAVR